MRKNSAATELSHGDLKGSNSKRGSLTNVVLPLIEVRLWFPKPGAEERPAVERKTTPSKRGKTSGSPCGQVAPTPGMLVIF
ncbi:UNVERIFIED_CONTAM: hypothetical protein FKN15_032171 [Acipenser sinensis]